MNLKDQIKKEKQSLSLQDNQSLSLQDKQSLSLQDNQSLSLQDVIKKDQVKAQKERNEVELGTLRLLLAEIHNQEIAKGKGEKLTDEEVMKVVKQQIKKRQEAIELYEKGGRAELVEKETQEMGLLKRYMPSQMSDEELEKIVGKVVSKMEGKDSTQFGVIMGKVMKEVAGRADGKRVMEMVKKALV
jgi:uncharacterized protein YqeY